MQLQKSLPKSSLSANKLRPSSLRKELNKNIDVASAKYLDGLRLQIFFTDESNQIIDFKEFFQKNSQFKKYSTLANFKKFKVVSGLLTWGKDWDIVFPTYSLHQGTLDNYNEDDGLLDIYVF